MPISSLDSRSTQQSTRWRVVFIAVWATLASCGVAFAQPLSPGDFVLQYTSATGNLTLRFTGTGVSGTGPVAMQTLDIITLGNADSGNPLMPPGVPGVTAGQGGLNGAVATVPSASFQILNSSSAGLNGVFSQVFNSSIGSTWRTFDLSNPGISDRLNLGNIAASGWSPTTINQIFMTDPDVYGGLNLGKFGYALADGVSVVGAVVPEPTTLSTVMAGGLLGLLFRCRKIVGDSKHN